MDPVADNERDELDENLCGFVGTHAQTSLAEIGLVAAEKLFDAVATHVNLEGLGKSARAFSVHCVNDK